MGLKLKNGKWVCVSCGEQECPHSYEHETELALRLEMDKIKRNYNLLLNAAKTVAAHPRGTGHRHDCTGDFHFGCNCGMTHLRVVLKSIKDGK